MYIKEVYTLRFSLIHSNPILCRSRKPELQPLICGTSDKHSRTQLYIQKRRVGIHDCSRHHQYFMDVKSGKNMFPKRKIVNCLLSHDYVSSKQLGFRSRCLAKFDRRGIKRCKLVGDGKLTRRNVKYNEVHLHQVRTFRVAQTW